MIRKPVSTAVLGGILVVVCDDGSLWEYDPNGKWCEREPIPGTAAGVRVESGRRYQGPHRAPREAGGGGGGRDGGFGGGSNYERRHVERRQRRDGRDYRERVPERRGRQRRDG